MPNHYLSNLPEYPGAAKHHESGGVVKLRHSVDANGKTTDARVISERAYSKLGAPPAAGLQLGEYLMKVLPQLDFLPGYRNGRPTATSYTLTWWFGRTIGW